MDLPDEIVCSILDWVIRELNGASHLHIALVSRQFYRCVLPLALRTIVVRSPARPSAFSLLSNLDPLSDLARRSIQDILVPHDSQLQEDDITRLFLAIHTYPNLHTLRLFWASGFSDGDYLPLSSPGSSFRPRRILTDTDLNIFLRTPGLEGLGDRVTHLLLDYYYALDQPLPRVMFPELTHLAVVVPARRCQDWSTCIEEILGCLSHPSGSSSLELFLLVFDQRNDEFFNSDVLSSLLERTAPEIILGSFGIVNAPPHHETRAKLILGNLRESYFDLQKPYPRYPDIWDRAQAVIEQRRCLSDSG